MTGHVTVMYHGNHGEDRFMTRRRILMAYSAKLDA
jgi:hypothetical protein